MTDNDPFYIICNCQLANTFAEFLARYLAKFGALFGNAQMTYREELSTIQHSKNWQKMNKGSSTRASRVQSSQNETQDALH
mgnify:CR=1 FL=1